MRPRGIARLALASLLGLSLAASANAATITIVNNDAPGEGYNDLTAVAPVGGNPGVTLGAQRLFAVQYAANVWGSILPSAVEIRINSQFNALSCTATSGVLASAGPTNVWRDFPGAPVAGHWYHQALANRLQGSDIDGSSNDINTQFNSSIGGATCLPSGWYYGVDGNMGAQIDLVSTALHEIGHGLGFSTTTSGSTGAYLSGFPSIYDRFLLDNSIGLHWDQMTAGQRQASAVACNRLVWDGTNATVQAASYLADKPVLRVNSPALIARDYDVGTASFGPPLSATPLTEDLVLVNDGVGFPNNGCEAFVNAAAVNGKIALLDRGGCPFVQKVLNAQAAGAIAVVIADSVAGCPPAGLGGTDPTVTIPSVRITLADGNLIKASLVGGVNATLIRDPALRAGADATGFVKVYTPSTFAGGSSVSHFDTSADPDLLMEPSITPLPLGEVDLTRGHFADIGWFQGLASAGESQPGRSRLLGNAPNPFAGSTSIRFTLERDAEVELSVYDLNGRLVAGLHRGALGAGSHAVRWDGMSVEGRRAAPGVYMYRLAAGAVRESGRMVLWR